MRTRQLAGGSHLKNESRVDSGETRDSNELDGWTKLSEDKPNDHGADRTRTATIGGKPLLIVRAATLSILKGPDAGREERIASPSFTIGGGASADLVLTDPSVSREHMQLSLMPTGVRVRDRSKNGT